MNTNKKGLAKNIASVGLIQIANYIFPLITIPIVSRIIGPDKLGIINFTSSFVAYFTLLIGFGFDLTATRRVAADPHNASNRNNIFSEVLTSQILLLLFSVVVFSISIYTIPQLKEEKSVAIFTFLTCFATLITQNWLFQAMQDLPKIAILNCLSKVIFTVVILCIIRQKSDYIWQPLALSLSQVCVSVISFIWAIKRYKLKFYFASIFTCLKVLWTEKTFFFSLVVINFYTNTNIVVLGLLQSATEVGYYTASQKLINIIQSLISIPLTQALFPYIGRAFAESFSKGLNIAQKIFPLVFVVTLLIGIVILTIGPAVLVLFYGAAFKPSIIVCQVLSFVPMLVALNIILGIQVMMNLKMDKLFLRIIAISAAISIVLNLVLIKHFGFVGSALTWLITEVVNFLLFNYALNSKGIRVIRWEYFSGKYFLSYIEVFKSKIFKKDIFSRRKSRAYDIEAS